MDFTLDITNINKLLAGHARPYRRANHGGHLLGQLFTYDLFDSLKTFRVWASWALVRRIVWATELLLGMRNNGHNFVVTQPGVIPAQRNRAPPCQIVADAAFLERLKIALKMLTHALKDLLDFKS
jgi:hypothetical protein